MKHPNDKHSSMQAAGHGSPHQAIPHKVMPTDKEMPMSKEHKQDIGKMHKEMPGEKD